LTTGLISDQWFTGSFAVDTKGGFRHNFQASRINCLAAIFADAVDSLRYPLQGIFNGFELIFPVLNSTQN